MKPWFRNLKGDITERQCQKLIEHGMKPHQLEGLSRQKASELIDSIQHGPLEGDISEGQWDYLIDLGAESWELEGLSKQEASDWIYAFQRGERPTRKVSMKGAAIICLEHFNFAYIR